MEPRVEFRVAPDGYRHWSLSIDGPVASLVMDVDETAGLREGYELKLNSYDLGVDIELYDIVQRLRFEHPEVRTVVVSSAKDRVFCAGANIRMLADSSHAWKVNFCKFTNETRNAMEDASAHSGQTYLAALNGTASGGGYELALACAYIMLVDDRSAAVSLPELPLLGVLPGTGGLTRLVDKRHVRRDRADYFTTKAEGLGGRKAVDWGFVDEVVPRPVWYQTVGDRAVEIAARSTRPARPAGIALTPLAKHRDQDEIRYDHVTCRLDRSAGTAEITVCGSAVPAPSTVEDIHAQGAAFWPLAVTRELDDLILDLRTNEPELGTWLMRTQGSPDSVLAYDRLLLENAGDWLVNEIVLYLRRTFKRLDVTSRSLLALIEPGSCFAGSLLELALAADRSYQLDGVFDDPHLPAVREPAVREPAVREPAVIAVGEMNLGPLSMGNGLTRLQSRFYGDDKALATVESHIGRELAAADALSLGLVTFAPDDLDWDDEVRIAVEERSSFSPDALSGMEANYRFVGPETTETKIFGRLSVWQNWIFNRPNAAGPDGALRAYGTGHRAGFDRKRV
jgi:benzoyl-CoA-dihydrodiol lyase